MTSSESVAGQRVLVTGASGFIGSHLVRRLVGLGCDVTAMVRPGSSLSRLRDLVDRTRVVPFDLGHGALPSIEAVDVVYHLAAAGVAPAAGDTAPVIQVNVLGTLEMLKLARSSRARRFVYCGSCWEYGPGTLIPETALPRPRSEYGASKVAGSMLTLAYVSSYGLPAVLLRPFTVYGPDEGPQRLVPYTIARALEGADIEVTSGDQTRDLVFVQDAVDAFLAAAVSPDAVGGTFNVCTGIATSVSEVVSLVLALTESRARPCFGARPHRAAEIMTSSGDPARTWSVIGWRAHTQLRDGLRATIRWFETERRRQA